jgi:hypothetical protein
VHLRAITASAAWSRLGPRAREVNARVTIRINHTLTLVAQPTDYSGWAASIAMLVDRTVEEVCGGAGMDVNTAYGWAEISVAVLAWGLVTEAAACALPENLAAHLDRHPLWMVDVGNPYHALVVGGMYSDGGDEVKLVVYNPWPPGSGAVEYKSFDDLDDEFALASGGGAQIIHQ